jgi:FlaA1/EpsC-like NDP-sugar epimerase
MDLQDLSIIGRSKPLFLSDFGILRKQIIERSKGSRILILGGAGSIGTSVVKHIIGLEVSSIHIVDINESALVEVVRNLRNSYHEQNVDLNIYSLDISSMEFHFFLQHVGPFDYIFNLAALKHVRSEGDPYTLMRMIQLNVVSNYSLLQKLNIKTTKGFFCVSSDKAAEAFNLMGATKSLMELVLKDARISIKTTSARFANVAFSQGSLLDSFLLRIKNYQPLAGPTDIRRYFITSDEAASLCIISAFVGQNKEIFFPKYCDELQLQSFKDIASRFLSIMNYEPIFCSSAKEAQSITKNQIINKKVWPCYFAASKTTGEKPEEIFYSSDEKLDIDRFEEIGVVLPSDSVDLDALDKFFEKLNALRSRGDWDKKLLIELIQGVLPDFQHEELQHNLSDGI